MSIATVIALLGWLVTGVGWYLSQRSQREALSEQVRNQVRNSARAEIASAVRHRQNLLSRIVAAGASLSVTYQHDVGAATWPEDKWREVVDDFRRICAGDDEQWAFVLEQYEVLFPDTAGCRRQLVERASVLADAVAGFSVHLLRKETRTGALSAANRLMERLMDEQGLLEDLLVHIHDVTLGAMVGKTAPFRQPQDPTVARVVMQSNGQLAIVEGAQRS